MQNKKTTMSPSLLQCYFGSWLGLLTSENTWPSAAVAAPQQTNRGFGSRGRHGAVGRLPAPPLPLAAVPSPPPPTPRRQPPAAGASLASPLARRRRRRVPAVSAPPCPAAPRRAHHRDRRPVGQLGVPPLRRGLRHLGGGEDGVGRGAERGAGEHPGGAGGVVGGAGGAWRARAGRRHGVPAPSRRAAPAPRRRPPPRRPHHRRPPQGLPHRISCNCNWHDGGLCAVPDEVARPGWLEDRRRSHGELHWRSGEFRGDLGGAGHDAVGGGSRRGGGQPHLGALLHGPLRAGVQDTAGAQERLVPGGRLGGPGQHVGAARRRGAGAVIRDMQGRHGDRGGAGRRGRRHAAVRDGAGGGPGNSVPGLAGPAGAVRRDHGADPDAGVLHGGGRKRQRGGRGDQGARRVRVRGGAGGRAPRRGARGREAGGPGQEAAAHRVQRQRRRADHGRRHGDGEGVELPRRARHPRRHLRDLHRHVPRHRLRHVRAPENFWLLVSGFLSSSPARIF